MTLKCIAGIEKPDKGRIIVDGKVLFDSEKNINLPPQERHVGMMFQNYALFPNMTVLENIRAGAKREKDKAKRESSVRSAMDSFGLSELAEYYPHQLSGGQQQRVALARILVSNPSILLLDEPFSALDSHLRFRLEQEVRSSIRSFGKTVLLVSHDRDEVYRMADSIAVINNGKIEVCEKKQTIFASPMTKAAAILTGCKNISPIKRLSENRIYASDWGIELSTNALSDAATHVGIRMREILPGKGENATLCRVVETIENPFSLTIMLQPVGAANALPIAWDTKKDIWKELEKDEIYISFPRNSLLLLEDLDNA